MAELQDIYLF